MVKKFKKKKKKNTGKQRRAKLKDFPWEHGFVMLTCYIQKSE